MDKVLKFTLKSLLKMFLITVWLFSLEFSIVPSMATLILLHLFCFCIKFDVESCYG